MGFHDLREFITFADDQGLVRHVNGADKHLEIGGLAELLNFHQPEPLLGLFDEIPGHPRGRRILVNATRNQRCTNAMASLPGDLSGVPLVQAMRDRLSSLKPIPPEEVATGPIQENVLEGDEVDLTAFPVPLWHEADGGPYIGTGCQVITRDEEDGWVNAGTYRIQLHGPKLAGIYMSPGRHGRGMMERYWARGEAAPVAIVCGADPTLLLSSGQLLPWGLSEYDFAGGLRGEPIEVLRSGRYGLPIPATSEIVLEGRIPPPSQETHPEGPFAEFTGYYASDTRPEPVVHVESIYHRHDPILLGSPPFRPTGESGGLPMRAALVWDALDAAGLTDIRGVYRLEPGGSAMLTAISLKQRYAGHAKQAALAAIGSRAGGYLSRYVILVDEDIDPSNQGEVLWAIATRCDPETSIDILRNCWGTALDPRLTPEKRAKRDYGISVAIIDATRPFHWREQYPPVNAISDELASQLRNKWGHLFTGNGKA